MLFAAPLEKQRMLQAFFNRVTFQRAECHAYSVISLPSVSEGHFNIDKNRAAKRQRHGFCDISSIPRG